MVRVVLYAVVPASAIAFTSEVHATSIGHIHAHGGGSASRFACRRSIGDGSNFAEPDSAVVDSLSGSIRNLIPRWVPGTDRESALMRQAAERMADSLRVKYVDWQADPVRKAFLENWENAVGKLTEMRDFVDSIPSPVKRAYHERIFQAAVSSLFKHSFHILNARDGQRAAVSDINEINKVIAAFDPRGPAFSLYKIKRQIFRRYSIREFTNCI